MLKVSLAVVSRGVQRTTPFSQARQFAKVMPASTKPSRKGQDWNVSWSGAMAKVMASLLSSKGSDRPHETLQATLGTRSRSIMATGSSWMPAGALEMSRVRVITSNSNHTSSQLATNNSGKNSYPLYMLISLPHYRLLYLQWTAIRMYGLSVPTGSPEHWSHAAVSHAWCCENDNRD